MVKQIRVPFWLLTESCLLHDEGHGAAACGWASFGGLRDVGALRNVSSALRTLPVLVGIAKLCVPLLWTWPFPVSALIHFPVVLTPGSVFPLGLSWSKLEHLCLTPAENKGRRGCFLTLTCFCSGEQTAACITQQRSLRLRQSSHIEPCTQKWISLLISVQLFSLGWFFGFFFWYPALLRTSLHHSFPYNVQAVCQLCRGNGLGKAKSTMQTILPLLSGLLRLFSGRFHTPE